MEQAETWQTISGCTSAGEALIHVMLAGDIEFHVEKLRVLRSVDLAEPRGWLAVGEFTGLLDREMDRMGRGKTQERSR